MENFLLDVIVLEGWSLVRKNNGKAFNGVLRLDFGVLFTEPLLA